MIKLIFRRRKYTSSKFTNLSIESEKSIRPFKAVSLLKLMKDYSQNSTSAYTSSTAMQSVKDIQYVFVQHNLEDKSEKECSICKFLDSEGIFQVNYQIAMSDYVFKSKDQIEATQPWTKYTGCIQTLKEHYNHDTYFPIINIHI